MTPPEEPSEPPEPPREEWDVDALWARVRARTVDAENGRQDGAGPAGARRPAPRWLRASAVAASLALAAGAAALLMLPRESPRAPQAAASYATAHGRSATIRLADGSEVTLAPESRLTVSAGFARGAREVSLDGEAIFSVRHDAAHPFRVRALGAMVEDIGTRFDLRAYPGDAAVTVAVVEGSVRLGSIRPDSAAERAPRARAIVLGSGEVGTLDALGNASAERTPRAAGYLGWANGRLSFENRPLPEVLRTIARWYDLDLRVTDARLAHRLVTAEFSRQSPAEMVDALAIALDATVERRGGVTTLRPR